MNKINNLVIGQGIGPAKFLMPKSEIIELFGKPDEEVSETEDGDKILTLFYDRMMTDFTFEEAEDGDFVLTSFLCSAPETTIDNKIKFGATEEEFLKYAKSMKASEPEVQTEPGTGEKFLYYSDLGLMAVFTDGVLSAAQLEYWDEEEPDE
ncbi:MAG: hypothetical protein II937_14865 [Bacteroidales bacterium]|nr:hypothetical protein [Bacteroidales bacterium]